jgi:hypothetical protein
MSPINFRILNADSLNLGLHFLVPRPCRPRQRRQILAGRPVDCQRRRGGNRPSLGPTRRQNDHGTAEQHHRRTHLRRGVSSARVSAGGRKPRSNGALLGPGEVRADRCRRYGGDGAGDRARALHLFSSGRGLPVQRDGGRTARPRLGTFAHFRQPRYRGCARNIVQTVLSFLSRNRELLVQHYIPLHDR